MKIAMSVSTHAVDAFCDTGRSKPEEADTGIAARETLPEYEALLNPTSPACVMAREHSDLPSAVRPGVTALDALRGQIFSKIRGGDFASLPALFPGYGVMLEALVEESAADAGRRERLEVDHETFFEQLKTALITHRIQVRLELERVNASRHYTAEASNEFVGDWQG